MNQQELSREQVMARIQELHDFLAKHPEIPTTAYGSSIQFCTSYGQDAGIEGAATVLTAPVHSGYPAFKWDYSGGDNDNCKRRDQWEVENIEHLRQRLQNIVLSVGGKWHKWYSNQYIYLTHKVSDGVYVRLHAVRQAVCTKVTKKVMVEVEKEVTEWECGSVLDGVTIPMEQGE